MCTAAEMKFYFASFENQGKSDYLTLNKNCNLTSWVSGCEPGWACSVGEKQKINLKDTKLIPSRTLNCKPCCEGFFCPHGMTCMIREYTYTYTYTYKFFFIIGRNLKHSSITHLFILFFLK